jgi:hypothetical protein
MNPEYLNSFPAVFANVQLTTDAVLHVRLTFEGELTVAMLKEHKQLIYERYQPLLANGLRLKILFDARQVSILNVPPSVMRENTSNDPFEAAQAGVALLINSKILQRVATFYIRIYQPKIPTRVFVDEANAIHWLNTLF